eukprot:jgi/Mesen1/2090/ME000151S01354
MEPAIFSMRDMFGASDDSDEEDGGEERRARADVTDLTYSERQHAFPGMGRGQREGVNEAQRQREQGHCEKGARACERARERASEWEGGLEIAPDGGHLSTSQRLCRKQARHNSLEECKRGAANSALL